MKYKKISSKIVKKIAVIIAFMLCVYLVPAKTYAQPGLPSDPPQSPIGGGIGILAAAGGAYAVKKLRDRKE